MSEFWKKKIRKYFSIIDLDSDGVASKNDFVEFANRYSKFGNWDEQKAEHVLTQFENVWELFVKNAETGDRDTLTADDLIVSVGKLRYDPHLMKYLSSVIRAFHDVLDVNRDGYLQEDEYQIMLSQSGVPDPSFAKMAFRAIDVNGDGKLSIEEFVDAFFDFLYSENENSPTAFMLGPLDV